MKNRPFIFKLLSNRIITFDELTRKTTEEITCRTFKNGIDFFDKNYGLQLLNNNDLEIKFKNNHQS